MNPSERLTLSVAGMTCGACATHVEWTLEGVSGVVAAKADLATESATVTYIPDGTDLDQLERAVTGAGYRVLALTRRAEARPDVQHAAYAPESRTKNRSPAALGFEHFVLPLLDRLTGRLPHA
ncbi:MAG: heavy-metal-associated domain-containing protein [Anaerolineae bacterium]